MRTNIRVIEIFVRVVESGSFVAAARNLLIDPAAVSRAIKGLEENLGILLFTRSTRVLKLTAEGARFYRDGAQMLRSFEETIRRFQADTAVQRQLRIGMGPALSRRMMLRAIPSFQDRYPQVRLILLSINDPAEIRDEGIDVLVRPRSTRQRGAEHRQPQGLVVRRLMQSPIMVCASPGYLERRGVPRAPADLAGRLQGSAPWAILRAHQNIPRSASNEELPILVARVPGSFVRGSRGLRHRTSGYREDHRSRHLLRGRGTGDGQHASQEGRLRSREDAHADDRGRNPGTEAAQWRARPARRRGQCAIAAGIRLQGPRRA